MLSQDQARCSKCDEVKNIQDFPTGYKQCKSCRKQYRKDWRTANTQSVREKERLRMRAYRDSHPNFVERERLYSNAYNAKHRKERLQYALERQAQGKAFINSFKSNPCKDCGQCFPPHVMDFDHIADDKHCDVGIMGNYSIERIKEEIAKCELVCSNCHRIRTYNRLNSQPSDPH